MKLLAVIKTGFIRGLHQAAGMTIVELENNRYDSLCCGFAAGYDQTQVDIEMNTG